ncbi:MAG: zinc ABC transporter substrate-binding protein [Acidobacteria bacterium]|nr:MAG: zinc ABC transporter substrate-binding protein [Acidobacteriota bacterium]RPJ76930.1 MAG: zinc ABC transporter substrate-binding protein [Acidobacteriota bacterium]
MGLLATAMVVFAAAPPAAAAPLNVVATTSSMGMLARVVGGDAVRVTVLAPPDRDAHYLLAKPSMLVALRRADLLVAVGADLEVGWLPAALQSANNPRILPGQPGYFEGAAQVDLIEKGEAADRARGDVHPMGNPHYYMDPPRMARVASALAGRLAAMTPAAASGFSARAEAFGRAVAERLPEWRRQVAGAPGAIFFHKDANYLAQLLDVKILAYVEPVPGIPPSASHLRDLVARLKGTRGVIIHATFQPDEGPQFLAKSLGWKVARLPLEVAVDADAAAYLTHIDQWVAAIASGK